MQHILLRDLAGKASGKKTPTGAQILAPLTAILFHGPGHVTLGMGLGSQTQNNVSMGRHLSCTWDKFAKITG